MFVVIVRGKDKHSWMAGSSSQDGVGADGEAAAAAAAV
jgi:hypothetical protein